MILFADTNLFGTGPATIEPGPTILRYDTQPTFGADGAVLTSQGREARSIRQRGTLVADSPEAVQQQLHTIESFVDGQGHLLIDDHEHHWSETVMLSVNPSRMRRVGRRWAMDYRIEYLQVSHS